MPVITAYWVWYSVESKSLDYITSVDLWADIIAMDYPSPHIHCLVRDSPWHWVLKHSQGGGLYKALFQTVSHAHNNGIVKDILIDRDCVGISSIFFESRQGPPLVVGLPKMLWNKEECRRYSDTVMVYRYTFDDTIIMSFWKHCF